MGLPVDRARLVQLVRRIIELDGSEEEIDALIAEFVESVPHPQALNVLGRHDDPDVIVEEALAYKAREMPPSPLDEKS
jgi:hypothetical protein